MRFPRHRQHVVDMVAACRRLGAPTTSRGTGTGTSGQAVGSGVVPDFSRRPGAGRGTCPRRRVRRGPDPAGHSVLAVATPDSEGSA
ncbi:hypothetical protein [Rhizohabitans arisaemae]|uniref:hypothetical protein n=1 Tax=Rhizohabitans arisaemae TaxID=2720610 RepID=UPI0024B0BFB0|nr:hypothetical protein [Rhizohabitans arisaemae]